MQNDVKYSTFCSALHGIGVKAEANLPENSVIFKERPYHFLQTIPNRQSCVVCAACHKPLGNISLQISILQGLVSRQNILQEVESFGLLSNETAASAVFSCPSNCGELYCSELCRQMHWSSKGHCFLCTGLISDDDAEMHPLINFKMHAISTNEIFLMVGELFATICCQVDALVNSGVELNQALSVASKPFESYVRQNWWDAAIPPKKSKPVAFKNSLKALVRESWALLNEVLCLDEKGYSSLLNAEYMSRTIGMFEQNNVGVQMKSPVAAYVEQILSLLPLLSTGSCTSAFVSSLEKDVDFLLDATERILDNLEDGSGGCGDECEVDDDEDGDNEEGEEEVVDTVTMMDGVEEDTDVAVVSTTLIDSSSSSSSTDSYLASVLDKLRSLQELVDIHTLNTLYPPLDGTAFYSLICRINHSCDPNVRVEYIPIILNTSTNNIQENSGLEGGDGLMAHMIVLRPIAAGEELLQSYIDQYQPYATRQKSLADYGFVCSCSKCLVERQQQQQQKSNP